MTDPAAEFAAAFLAAQREFPTIAKTKTADMGNYKYKYADLGDVLDQALPILHRHGIALSQPPATDGGSIGVQTRLIHESGHIEDCGTLLLPSGSNPQAAGSAMTYARRYAACAALGIVADEDDDGRAASRPVETPPSDDELAERGTNKLKAEALALMGDKAEAQAVWMQALEVHGLPEDAVIPLDLQAKVRDTLQEMAP